MNTKPNMSLSTIEEALEEAAAREPKYDPLSTVSAVAETAWALLMVACVLSLLWSMLGRGPTYGPSETSENHSGASASRPNHHRAGHHGLAARRGSLLPGATEPAVNLGHKGISRTNPGSFKLPKIPVKLICNQPLGVRFPLGAPIESIAYKPHPSS